MPDSPYQSISKPISMWDKELQIEDSKALFASLGKAGLHLLGGQFADSAVELVDAFQATGFDRNDIGQLGWVLLRNAMTNAAYKLLEVGLQTLERERANPKNAEAIATDLDTALGNVEIEINRDFFDNPRSLPVVTAYREQYQRFLNAFGFAEKEATDLVAQLPDAFEDELMAEWLRHADVYEPINLYLDAPFMKARERRYEWQKYYQHVKALTTDPMFAEDFGLADVYMPLRGYYLERDEETEEERSVIGQRQKKEVRVVVDLRTELDAWIQKADANDAIRLLSGGPGSGKSSFSRMYAVHLTKRYDLRVMYIPLHWFNPKSDLKSGLADFIDLDPHVPLTENPLESKERLLIIFDGLDELAMQGKVGTQVARDFVDYISYAVNRMNRGAVRLQILLAGREIVVQTNRHKFKREGQILHAVPYFVTEKEEVEYRDDDDLLAQDQRNAWWQKYGQAIDKPYEAMPEALNRADLAEITGQPLLNYLVAFSYVHGELDFTDNVNLNQIYANLLDGVYSRDWEAARREHYLEDLSKTDFIRILEEIGIATWHGDGRATTIDNVRERCEKSGLMPLLKSFREGAEAGVGRLLTAFYFRQQGMRRDGTETFEFTHKSFGEYLTARRLVSALDTMYAQMQSTVPHEVRWDERKALAYWLRLYGNAPRMSFDLAKFIRSEVALRTKEEAKAWQQMLCELISWMLEHGMPMDELNPRLNYAAENQAAIHAEEGLLALLSACAEKTEARSEIAYFRKDRLAAGTWLHRLRGQRTTGAQNLALASLHRLSLRNCNLEIQDLSGAYLIDADLRRVDLRRANLRRADLKGADLIGATLIEADLREADLIGATLIGATLREANLSGANLSVADLSGADLIDADLRRVDLRRANLRRADLKGADLSGANLWEANLWEANLRGADLRGAYLTGATLPDGTKWEEGRDMREFTDPT